MKYLSLCSGIEAASVAWESLGWDPVAFSEIEPFPSADGPQYKAYGNSMAVNVMNWLGSRIQAEDHQ